MNQILKNMKYLLTFILLMCSYVLCGAQATTLIVDNQTPGWLSSKINYGDQQTVENLKVTGYLNADDLKFIGTLIQTHSLSGMVDLEDCQIINQEGVISNMLDKNAFSFGWQANRPEGYCIRHLKLPIKLIHSKECLTKDYLIIDTLTAGGASMPIINKESFSYHNRNIKHLILREGVTTIEDYACDNNVEIETVSCPESMEFIGTGAFRECSALSLINLPDNITEIQQLAFEKSSFVPDTLKLPESLEVYYTNSFSLKNGQVIELGSNVSKFDNESWTLTKNTAVTYIINRVVPPTFNKGAKENWYQPSYSDGKELSGCTLYVPKNGYSMYVDPEYNSVGPGGTWSGWSNPYSHAKVKTIYIPVINISLNHSSCSLNVGNTINLMADVQPNDADNKDIVWQSNNASIASVNNDGLVSALSCGNAIITAFSKENASIKAACEITVHQPLQSIALTPTNIRLKAGEMYEGLSISYNPATADNKHVTWQSSNPSIATVDSNGKITAITGGEVKIIVKSEENHAIKAECIVSVIQPVTGISINKSVIELIEEEFEQLIATITPDNASDKEINWTSSDISVAMVSPDGTVYAIKPGQATIMATTADGGFVALCKIKVKAREVIATSIQISPSSKTVAIGETIKLNALLEPENVTNANLSWTSSNPNIATVDVNGLVKAIAEGKTQIIATTTDGSNLSAICEIMVEKQFIGISQIQITPSNAKIAIGKTLQLNAIIAPSDATSTNLLWSSTNTSVAKVSQNGQVDAIAEGEAIIIASTQDGSNLSAACVISVYQENVLISDIILNPTHIEGLENESVTINAVVIPDNATNKRLKWSSSNESVAVVNDGVVNLIKGGSAIICAEALDGSNIKSECTIIVSEAVGIESIIEDKNTYVKIFNLKGFLVYEGIFAEAKIKSGIYIVLCQGKCFKTKVD